MANLFQIDNEIISLIDPETGEVKNFEAFEALAMERDAKIENVACWIKNLEADAAALKAEKLAMADRQAAAEKKAAKLKDYLAMALNGQKFSTAKCAVSFRKSTSLEISDEQALASQLMSIDRIDLLSIKDPTIDKKAVTAALKAGEDIPGATLVDKQNVSVK